MEYEELIGQLVRAEYLKTPAIIEAFKAVKRADFMKEEMKKFAFIDRPMPIGYGQTISQPLVVAFMLELLQPQINDNILDVGSGSGWTATLLAQIVSQGGRSKRGKVTALEIVPELREFGEKNSGRYGFVKEGIVEFICADGYKGCPEESPYDRILVSAGAQSIPSALKEQLKIGGRMVIPVGSSICLFVKKSGIEGQITEYPGFAFVPLLEASERLRKKEVLDFLDNPLQAEIFRTIILFQKEGLAPSTGQIANWINLELSKISGSRPCSYEEMSGIIDRLAELKLVKPAWVLAVSPEELMDITEDLSERPVAGG